MTELPMVDSKLSAQLHVANMMRLCRDLRIPVVHKVHEETAEPSLVGAGMTHAEPCSTHPGVRKFVVIVHVQSDFAFKKYFDSCSCSDLMLYRGLLLEVTTLSDVSKALSASVRQAFLPKFEIEDKDTSVANCIVDQASERFMVVTVKHSGSLVTLSGLGFAAKNSVNNAFTAGAQTLLKAHYERVFGTQQGPLKLASLMKLLHAHHMAVSFEMVTGSHGHHGQLPAAEYLVATAAHIVELDTGKPRFLTWLEFLRFCVDQHLPVNDTWLLAGCEWAAAARDVLDYQALNGGVTALAIVQLNKLVQDGASSGCLHLPGTYPHHQWQGSRLEGFVVAQGQPVAAGTLQALSELRALMAKMVLPLETFSPTLRSPYHASLQRAQAQASTGGSPEQQTLQQRQQQHGQQQLLSHASQQQIDQPAEQQGSYVTLKPVDRELGQQVVRAVMDVQAPGILVRTPSGEVMACRSALSSNILRATHAQLTQLLAHTQAASSSKSAQLSSISAQAGVAAGLHVADAEALQKALCSIPEGSAGIGDPEGAAAAVPGLRQALARIPRALIGAPGMANTLRYKKKMLLWMTPLCCDTGANMGGSNISITTTTAATSSSNKRKMAEPNSVQQAAGASEAGVGEGGSNKRSRQDAGPGGAAAQGAQLQGVQGMEWEGGTLQPPAASNDDVTHSTLSTSSAVSQSAQVGGHRGTGSTEVIVSCDVDAAAEQQAAQGGVGYCMLTFIIRNGLPALKLGLSTYLAYCDNQAEKLGLGKKQKGQVNMFARIWASWIDERGGAGVVQPLSYLDYAEPFVREFLSDLAAGRTGGERLGRERPQGAFQGLLVLVDVPHSKALALKVALHAAHVLEATELPPYSKALATQGSLILMPPGSPVPKPAVISNFFNPAGGGSQVFVYVEPLSPEIESSNAPEAKKMKGMRTGKLKTLKNLFKGPKEQPGGKGKQQKHKQQQEPGQQQQEQQQQVVEQQWQARVLNTAQKSVEEIVQWVGPGAPLPPADPAAILCFVSIPATGKSTISGSLQPPLGPRGAPVQLKILNSDSLKGKGLPANRFWHDVAAAADSNIGGGSCTAVLADKNLVLHPRENVERNARILKDSGATAAAVVPTCGGTSSATTQPQLYADLPPMPFPLELVALCMLRTIKRKGHVGNLDSQAPNPLAIMASFATFFKHTSLKKLLKYLRTQFDVVAELLIMEAADTDPHRQVPSELLQHVAAGLELALKERVGGELSPTMIDWEKRMRSLLEQPDVERRLLSLQRPLEACQMDLQGIMDAALQHAQQPATACDKDCPAAEEESARWVAVTGFESEVLQEEAQRLLPAEMQGQIKEELHITLWHRDDPDLGPDQELQQCLLGAVGSDVTFEVTHMDSVLQGVAAAKVQLTSGPEAVLAKLSQRYLHITLVIGPSGQAKDAKLLEGAVARGSALRCPLPEPLQLTGQILAVQE